MLFKNFPNFVGNLSKKVLRENNHRIKNNFTSMNWYLKVLRQYADFNGRARRKEYWMFFLFNVVISLSLLILTSIFMVAKIPVLGGIFYILIMLYSLALIVPGIAVTVRRLHDIGKEWVYILVALIPLVGPIWLLVMCVQDSVPGSNQYGPNPKEIAGEA